MRRVALCMMLIALGLSMTGQDTRPNIIFIITDDQHRDQFNYLPEGRDGKGKPLNLTPNLDRLASGGVILDQCYVSTPVCTPSRYSILTGTYASRARNENFVENARTYDQTNV
ncbi:MAG: sulfatase-like hydrolase/transferase, partial [Bacteroidales bacterium]|nr:sulfatase-like hydrolase/transferase [Bacteroidales bacterium]